jgi:peptidoglycan/LPS O-acetylase OafA/YrhL
LARALGCGRTAAALFVTLGQGSLGAFVLHVYGLLLLAHLPETETLWINTIMQVLLIVGIAAALKAINRVPVRRRMPIQPQVQPVAA